MTKDISTRLFEECRKAIPSAAKVANAAFDSAIAPYKGDRDAIKRNFSKLISDVQKDAYQIYLEAESKAAGEAISTIMRPLVTGGTAEDAFNFIAKNFIALDKFSLSLTQSRRTRAGTAFEIVMSRLLELLQYEFVPQPKLPGSNPDYVMPSMEHYRNFAADCIILTCKRTLRERWRQIVTEGSTGTTFFLATIDEKLSKSEIEIMKSRNVVMVVPIDLKSGKYRDFHNVITFETFFLHHLDPAVKRWNNHS